MKHAVLSTTALLVVVGFGASSFAQQATPAPTAPAPTAPPAASAPTSGEMKQESEQMDRAARKAERKAEKERRKAERKAEKEKRKAEKKARKEARGKGVDDHEKKDGEKRGEAGKD